jgi:hypothetical protein
VAPTTQCNDVARIGQFRDLNRLGNFGCTPGKARERQIILNPDRRTIFLKTGPGSYGLKFSWLDVIDRGVGGKFQAKSI